MPSPFPGMDPWLEDIDGWRGVHTRLVTISGELLQPQLRAMGYFVDIEERVWVEDSERHVYPDLAIIERPKRPARAHSQASVAEADEPVVVRARPVPEIHERYLQVFATKGRQLVTQIEFISHSNKSRKLGRELYVQKREELIEAAINVVEIDLLRAGTSVVDLGDSALQGLKPWDYIVNITRAGNEDNEVYPIRLRDRLPRIRIPLRDPSPDAVLDLQAALERVYDTGPYPDRLDYTSAPIPPLSMDDAAWAHDILVLAGLRQPATI